jgi:hypothetical protein
LELPVVPTTQAYAWPGLADIFLRLVLRFLGWEGEVEIKGMEVVWGRERVFRCRGG